MRISIFNVAILCLGVGFLTLPQKFGEVSILFFSIIVFIAGFTTFWTLDIIIEAARKQNLTVYSHIIEYHFGHMISMIFDITLIIYVIGTNITYQIISKIIIVSKAD
jgi:amino acid permease